MNSFWNIIRPSLINYHTASLGPCLYQVDDLLDQVWVRNFLTDFFRSSTRPSLINCHSAGLGPCLNQVDDLLDQIGVRNFLTDLHLVRITALLHGHLLQSSTRPSLNNVASDRVGSWTGCLINCRPQSNMRPSLSSAARDKAENRTGYLINCRSQNSTRPASSTAIPTFVSYS
jgi:hypothetical protein